MAVMGRIALVITDADGKKSAYGTWRSWDRASKIHNQLLDYSGSYGGDGPEFEVEIVVLHSWPGIRDFKYESEAGVLPVDVTVSREER